MAFKSASKFVCKIVIIFALINTFFDIFTIFIVRPAQYESQIELSNIQTRVKVKLVDPDPTVINNPIQGQIEQSGSISDNDYLILTSAADSPHASYNNKKKKKKVIKQNYFDNQNDFDRHLHKEFWKHYKNVNRRKKNGNFSDSDINFISKFQNVSLWPHHNKTKSNWSDDGFGFGSQYDSRVMAQFLWGVYAKQIKPDIFKQNKTKKILIRDSYEWWKYKGGRHLSCPGNSFDGRCEVLDSSLYHSKNIDAHIAVRDSFHSSRLMFNRNTAAIYFILESPLSSPSVSLFRPNDYLASYWRGSDIQTSYGKWAYYNPKIRKMKQKKNYAAGKTKMAAIFVSNCDSYNARLEYVQQLSKHVQVDVYGECGTLTCGHDEQAACFDKLKMHYRFYLSFENSNCRDYITEKFFINALQNDVIPIVLGAHRDDYKAAAPEDSFIHVEDFLSPKFLAAYMNSLAKNDDLYNAYFEWKGTGEFIQIDFFCRVCSLLFYADKYPRESKQVKMSEKWKYYWSPQQQRKNPMCLTSGRWYWSRENHELTSTVSVLNDIENMIPQDK